jgi:hypothetical protein
LSGPIKRKTSSFPEEIEEPEADPDTLPHPGDAAASADGDEEGTQPLGPQTETYPIHNPPGHAQLRQHRFHHGPPGHRPIFGKDDEVKDDQGKGKDKGKDEDSDGKGPQRIKEELQKEYEHVWPQTYLRQLWDSLPAAATHLDLPPHALKSTRDAMDQAGLKFALTAKDFQNVTDAYSRSSTASVSVLRGDRMNFVFPTVTLVVLFR